MAKLFDWVYEEVDEPPRTGNLNDEDPLAWELPELSWIIECEQMPAQDRQEIDRARHRSPGHEETALESCSSPVE